MSKSRRRPSRSLQLAAFASVSLTAVSAHAAKPSPPVSTTDPVFETPLELPVSGPVRPHYGNISAFYGNISAFTGNISAFTGTVTPSYGNISAFYGNISAFQGKVDPFWGNISAFQTGLGSHTGAVMPSYGNISAFWGEVNPLWGNISAFWSGLGPLSTPSDLNTLSSQITSLQSKSEAFWGAAVRAQTGKSFYEGFAKGVYAKYGVDPANPRSFQSVTPINRNMFILDWFDGLMNFTGTDHVDWWMQSANWTPLLTQTQGSGADTRIGLLDFSIDAAAVGQGTLTTYTGVSNFSNGHGSAVASLMVAPHDGRGVMGIAPRATVLAYNPFDASGTANWDDITRGVATLAANRASVINMSLGVPGYTLHPDWNQVFTSPSVVAAAANSVFVIAAGNDGVSQTENVAWSAANPNIIVVGSVGPTDAISSFSNRPGSACLGTARTCPTGSRLMDRFITAPGELILVADDAGGTTRKVGTSFAAPLVSGAIALMHDRWPWLAAKPKETSDIILKSARDVGAAGTDPVYGVGVLDVTASQSPLSFDALKFFMVEKDGKLKEVENSKVRETKEQDMEKYDVKGLFYYGYETIGSTYRDFAIPLSSKLIGQKVTSAGGTQEQFQQYVFNRMTDWMAGGTGVIHEGGKKGKGFRFSSEEGVSLPNAWGLSMTLATKPWANTIGYRASQIPMQTDLNMTTADGRHAFRVGYGPGAAVLSGLSGFALPSDFDSSYGGANPVLGLASGGAFAKWSMAITPRLSLAAGFTEKRARLDLNQLTGPDRIAFKDLADYRARADHVSMTYRVTPALAFTTGVTRLDEASGLLGVRSADPNDLRGGSATDAATFGAEWTSPNGLRLSAAGTYGRTQDAGPGGSGFATAGGGLKSTAYEVALDKAAVFDGRDRVRFTLSQPLTVEGGKLAYTTVQVVDRQTGQLGAVTQMVDAKAADRRQVAEFLYGHDVLSGAGEWGVFGRAETRSEFSGRQRPEMMAGARFRISY